MKKVIFGLLLAVILKLQSPLFAQDPSGSVPDDSSTAMTTEQGDPIPNTDEPNNDNVPGDPNYSPPEGPFTPELPDSGNYEGPVGVTGIFNGNVATAGSYDPLSHSAHRVIDDIVVPGSIGKYPLKMTRYYNSRQQYYALGAIGLSPGWSHEYSWLLWGDGTKVISPHGSVQDFYCDSPVGVSEGWEGAHSPSSGTWRLADGGKVVFENSRVIYIDDPYGQRTTIEYDGNWYRTKVTEPGGRYLKFIYGPAADPDGTLMLTRVEAHALGNATVTDWVNYSYTSVSPGVEGRNKMMLTRVDYPDSNPNYPGDNTHAHYQYCNDNVHEGETTHKVYPLLRRCDDVRYTGVMRSIWYNYEDAGPHGAIVDERYPGSGVISAISPRAVGHIFTETRGDGPTRSFTYTTTPSCHGSECGPCDAYEINPPQQMLLSYTDFQGHATQLGYDTNTWYVTSLTDVNGHTTLYERGPPLPAGIGQITKITHPDNTYIQYVYENEGTGKISGHYMMSVRDERGNKTVHIRDSYHRITRTDYKDANNVVFASEDFTYNSFGQILTHHLKNGKYQHFQYDNRGLLLARTNPTETADWQSAVNSSPKTTYSYWSNAAWADRVFRITLPRNGSNQTASERYEYDRNGASNAVPGRGLVTKITHADDTWQSFGYSQFGNKMWEENELRQRTAYSYDNYSRLLSVTKPLVGAETCSYLKPGASSPYLHTSSSIYRHTSRTGIVTANEYDPDWRKISTTTAGARTQFAYDSEGNLTDITDPRNKATHNVYDNRNRKTSTTEAYGIQGLAATTVWHYNSVGSIFKIDRPDGQSETKGYDALNRATWHTVPRQIVGGGQVDVTTHIFYNPSGTIQKVRNENGRDTEFEYDPSDRKTKMWYPGHTQFQAWAYDDVGNLMSRTTVHGGTEVQRFEYDNLNRKISMRWDNGADSATYGYDNASRLTSANNPNSNVTRTYDAAGRLTHDQQNVIGLGVKDVSYLQYDDDGRMTRLSAAGIYDYTFGYDAMGRFETMSTGGSVKFRYAYDAASNETDRYAYFNGITIDQIYGRDSLDRMSSRVLKKNGATIAGTTESYTYDHMNRLRETNRDGVADSFNYYWTGELMSADYGGGSELPYHEGQDPDLDTTDALDPNAGYQPPGTAEVEPSPPADDTPPPDSTANTTPSPDSTPPNDTPPAEDPTKGQKTVDDYLGDGKRGPEGPAPDVFTGRSVRYNLDKAGNRIHRECS